MILTIDIDGFLCGRASDRCDWPYAGFPCENYERLPCLEDAKTIADLWLSRLVLAPATEWSVSVTHGFVYRFLKDLERRHGHARIERLVSLDAHSDFEELEPGNSFWGDMEACWRRYVTLEMGIKTQHYHPADGFLAARPTLRGLKEAAVILDGPLRFVDIKVSAVHVCTSPCYVPVDLIAPIAGHVCRRLGMPNRYRTRLLLNTRNWVHRESPNLLKHYDVGMGLAEREPHAAPIVSGGACRKRLDVPELATSAQVGLPRVAQSLEEQLEVQRVALRPHAPMGM